MIHKTFLLLFLISNLFYGEAARILASFPFAGKSHTIYFNALLHELARRGHDVTVASPWPSGAKIKNLHEINFKWVLDELAAKDENLGNSMKIRENNRGLGVLKFLSQMSQTFCETTLNDPKFQPILKGEGKFDLIISSNFLCECHLGLLHVYKDTPFIQMSSFGGWNWMLEVYGNPQEIASIRDPLTPLSEYMPLWERTLNFMITVAWRLFRDFYHIPAQQEILYKYFGPDVPNIKELEQRSSLLFINSESSMGYPRALSQNIISTGGMHIVKSNPLPEELKKWLDESEHGVIYFSLGSAMKSADLPLEKRESLLEAFGKLKQRILWKWEEDVLPGQPKNVRLGKWLPQNDLLSHPKIKLFITHGGLLSSQEAIYHGVPVVGIPCMADQMLNMRRVVEKGLGVMVNVENITETSVSWALNEVLGNPKYKETAKHLSQLFRDQPMDPLEKAVFWTEYVLRHKGAHHLSNPAKKLCWFQRELLDVYIVILSTVIGALWVIVKTLKIIFRKCCGKSKSKSKRE